MAKFNARITDEEKQTLEEYSKAEGLSMTVLFKLWIKEVRKNLDKTSKDK